MKRPKRAAGRTPRTLTATMTAAEFQAMPRRVRNASSEHDLQCAVVRMLDDEFPNAVWTANMAGVRLSVGLRKKMKDAGMRPGWPDLQFLLPDGRFGGIELKAGSSPSKAQKDFAKSCACRGAPYVVCRSIEAVRETLAGWLA